jgi:uncharacterized protein YeaO (DUF488 family)
MGKIKLVRIYSADQPAGYRILVDRLWPRGMSKVRAQLDRWDKEIAPSKELRQWFGHDPAKFSEFKQRYQAELQQNPDFPAFLALVKKQLKTSDVLFLYGAKNKEDNQAVVLADYVQTCL